MAQRRNYHNFRHPKKAAFLAAYRECGSIRYAAEAAGVDRTTYYQWCEVDPDFVAAAGLAKADAVEALENEARRRAMEGVRKEKPIFFKDELLTTVIETEFSDTLLIFLLKGAAPEKYRENINVTQTQTVKVIDSPFYEAV